jgi:hypothetical protein
MGAWCQKTYVKGSIVGAAVLALFFIFCSLGGDHAEPRPHQGTDTVTAGDFITFVVDLNQAPQFAGGRLQVIACPGDGPLFDLRGSLCRATYSEATLGQQRYTLSLQVPGDEDKEEWWEASVAFALPNGEFKDLAWPKVKFKVAPKAFFKPGDPLKVTRFAAQ